MEGLEAELVVVDDASADDTAVRATRAGARVLRHEAARGPDEARNTGWRATTADVVAFVDVRCRVAPGWLEALVAGATRPGVAIAGNGYEIAPGETLASRAAAALDGFRVTASMDDPVLPYLPGGNIAMRRTVLEQVGGFAAHPTGGGDMTICWAAQLAGLGEIAVVEQARLTWVPRRRLRDFVAQRRKYGTYRVHNELRFTSQGIVPSPPSRFPLAARLVGLAHDLRRTRARGIVATVVGAVTGYAYHRAYRTEYLRLARAGLLPPAPPRLRRRAS